MIRPIKPARRKCRRAPSIAALRRARPVRARALQERRRERERARRQARETRVLAYLNVRAERHTEEKLAVYWSKFPYWAPTPNALLPTTSEKLESGEASPALVREMLGQWIGTVAGLPPPPGIPESQRDYWIAQRDHWVTAFRKIAKGAEPSMALRLKIGHRRPGKERDMLAARDAWWLIHRENVPAEQAFAMVARPLAVKPKHIRDLYYEHRDDLAAYFSRR
ncbi:hypothetical protein [Paraburkholderia sp. J7]|uniref:hypothetical protein n=1 Tax=Paraburkholderia sp. J7 TaxID=2805438 RepID=UPI002AB774A2|nr:hypothetical protein [Paraburkholderia sp. J7]